MSLTYHLGSGKSRRIGDYKAMPNRIRELRIARNLTLEEVALNVGTSVQQLSRLERGSRRLTDDWMRRVARALYVRPADLFADSGEDNREVIERPEEVRLLRFWRLLSPDEKRMIAAFARDKGLEILNNHTSKRRA
jgi:transcriptional regulator with XRE-family HTH domain